MMLTMAELLQKYWKKNQKVVEKNHLMKYDRIM